MIRPFTEATQTMCGIAGAFDISDRRAIDPAAVTRMRKAVDDRGPDARRVWMDPERRAGLAHARLSTLDPSPSATQPLWDSEGRVVVVANGEIYNDRKLRAELERAGCVFRTNSDAEVLPNGFKVWGLGLLDRIKGQFAFALFDTRTGECLVARDPRGISPLYYAENDGTLYFGSTVDAVLAGSDLRRSLDLQAAHDFFVMESYGWGRTPVAGVHALTAGCALSFFVGANPAKHRFNPPRAEQYEIDGSMNEEDWIRAVRAALGDAAATSMRGDKEVGAYLSGGVDSISVQALVKEAYPDLEVKTFSTGFEHALDGQVVGEIQIARQVSEYFGTTHHEIIVSGQDLAESMGTFDLPADGIMPTVFRKMAARVAETGVAVALTGEGSDELFFGYDHAYAALGFLDPEYSRKSERFSLRGDYAARLTPDHARLTDVFRGGGANIDMDNDRRRWFGESAEVTRPVRAFVDDLLAELTRHVPDMRLDQQILCIEYFHKIPENFLRRGEGPSMALGVELRFPYLWDELYSVIRHMPTHVLLGDGQIVKRILRRAVSNVIPEEFAYRAKSPFGLPASRKTYFANSGTYFDRPAFTHFFWKYREPMQEIVLDGAWRRERIFADGVIESHVARQLDESTASFDAVLWKMWSFAAWYERVLGTRTLPRAEHGVSAEP